MSTTVRLYSPNTLKLRIAAVASLVVGGVALGVLPVVGNVGSFEVLLGFCLVANGVLLLLASRRGPVLVIDTDAIGRDDRRRNEWRLRWAHMVAVRFGTEELLLVPAPGVAEHPEIAPALEPRDIDGTAVPTFAVALDERTMPAVRAAVTQHAPPQLFAQSSPRPPST